MLHFLVAAWAIITAMVYNSSIEAVLEKAGDNRTAQIVAYAVTFITSVIAAAALPFAMVFRKEE